MNLDAQVQSLIDGAPDLESRMSVMAVGAALKQVAETFPHTHYYISQSTAGDWVVTTLRNSMDLTEEIQVIYAYGQPELVPEVAGEIGFKLPIVQLLFELLAIPTIDRALFVHLAGGTQDTRTIGREDLQQLVAQYLQQLQSASLPPDVC
jgi:hypothetical protein